MNQDFDFKLIEVGNIDSKEEYNQLVHDAYDTLCQIEHDIINKKFELRVLHAIVFFRDRVQELEAMPTCILIKIMQITQLPIQMNIPILKDYIRQLQQVVQRYDEKYYKQLKLIENTENYEISKAYIFDNQINCKYIALSPNEKYLLLGTSRQVYLYDILTKLNIKIYKQKTQGGLFSKNSKKIILETIQRKIIIDINTNKYQQHLNQDNDLRTGCFLNKNYLYQSSIVLQSDIFRIKVFDLHSNRFIFQYNMPNKIDINVQVFEDMIALQFVDCLKILNQQTRKLKLDIKLSDYRIINNLFFITINKMISKDQEGRSIIWNINYENNSLIQQLVLPFSANNVIRGNQSFGYFYLISDNQYEIIDENYNSIYQTDKQKCYLDFNNSIQLSSDRIFILFQKMGYTYQKEISMADILQFIDQQKISIQMNLIPTQ